jgi:Holliday junction resolvase-like predicted endonuclease
LIAERLKTPFAEVDLFFETPQQELLLVEVKSLSRLDWMGMRLGVAQRNRLLRAAEYLAARWDRPLGLTIAFVFKDVQIIYRKILN